MCDEPAYRRDVFSMSAIHVIAERLVQLTKQLHWLTKVTQHFTATDKKGTLTKCVAYVTSFSVRYDSRRSADQSTYVGGTVSQAFLGNYSSYVQV
jgi:hypothetical protein